MDAGRKEYVAMAVIKHAVKIAWRRRSLRLGALPGGEDRIVRGASARARAFLEASALEILALATHADLPCYLLRTTSHPLLSTIRRHVCICRFVLHAPLAINNRKSVEPLVRSCP